MSYGTPYLDYSPANRKAVGRAKKPMAKPEVKAENTNTKSKRYAKTRGEHYKDIVIAILIAGVVAFVAGVHYADSKNAQMQTAVKAASITAQAPAVKK